MELFEESVSPISNAFSGGPFPRIVFFVGEITSGFPHTPHLYSKFFKIRLLQLFGKEKEKAVGRPLTSCFDVIPPVCMFPCPF